jgi:L,D-transpeptidase ErfK/SrfK
MRTVTIVVTLVMSLMLLISGEASATQRYSEILCQQPTYTCFKVPKGETWLSLFPDEQQRALIMRINRMNVPIHTGMIIAVPADLSNSDYLRYAPFTPQIYPTGNKLIIVDPATFAWGAYDESGNLINWGPVAMGKNWCPDINRGCRTATGLFAVYREGGSGCKSTKFPVPNGGAPMPYCMFFKGGYALHASNEVPGYHASHGCVRLFYEDAQWLNQQFVEPGTTVIVKPYAT